MRRWRGLAIGLLASVAWCGSAQAGTPTTDGHGNWQQFDVAASPPVAGAGIVFDLQQTYWNSFGLPPRAPRSVVIHFPVGTSWNGDRFPQCDPGRLLTQGPAACPAGSRFASADVVAALGLQQLPIHAGVADFVGPNRTQLLWVTPAIGPAFLLTGVISSSPHDVTLTFDLTPLPAGTALAPSPVVITSIHNVDIHTSVGSTPLIVAPPTCDGYWDYAFDSVFSDGGRLRSTSRQPCVAAPKPATAKKKRRARRRS